MIGEDDQSVAAQEEALRTLPDHPPVPARASLLASLRTPSCASATHGPPTWPVRRSTWHGRSAPARRRPARSSPSAARRLPGRPRRGRGGVARGAAAGRCPLRRGPDASVGTSTCPTSWRHAGTTGRPRSWPVPGLEIARQVGQYRSFGVFLLGNLVEPLIRLGDWADAERLGARGWPRAAVTASSRPPSRSCWATWPCTREPRTRLLSWSAGHAGSCATAGRPSSASRWPTSRPRRPAPRATSPTAAADGAADGTGPGPAGTLAAVLAGRADRGRCRRARPRPQPAAVSPRTMAAAPPDEAGPSRRPGPPTARCHAPRGPAGRRACRGRWRTRPSHGSGPTTPGRWPTRGSGWPRRSARRATGRGRQPVARGGGGGRAARGPPLLDDVRRPRSPGSAAARRRRASCRAGTAGQRPFGLTDREREVLGPGRRRPVERADRLRAVHQPEDGERPRLQHPGQARRQRPGRGRRRRAPARPRAASAVVKEGPCPTS